MSPLVSVVTPCFRQGHFLSDAVESVLAQSHRDLEIIVVDDGSPDDTSSVVRTYARRDSRVRLVQQSNSGLARARNAGLAQARGTYVVFLDADDRLLPDALAAGMHSLEQHPDAVYARGRFELIDARGRILSSEIRTKIQPRDEYEALLRDNPIWVPAAVMFRRTVFDRTPPFDPRVDAAADLEMYLRLARLYPVISHSTRVAQYRRHPLSMSMDPFLMAPAVFRVLDAQREYVDGEPRLREAHRRAMVEWERQYLLPMIRRAPRKLGSDPRATLAGLPLMAAYGPRALARRLVLRSRAEWNGAASDARGSA